MKWSTASTFLPLLGMMFVDMTSGKPLLRSNNDKDDPVIHRKLQRIHKDATIIPDSYIVLFHENKNGLHQRNRQLAGRSLATLEKETGMVMKHEYTNVLNGAIAIENVSKDVLYDILEDPTVKNVVQVRQ
jgi:hypothetical protein